MPEWMWRHFFLLLIFFCWRRVDAWVDVTPLWRGNVKHPVRWRGWRTPGRYPTPGSKRWGIVSFHAWMGRKTIAFVVCNTQESREYLNWRKFMFKAEASNLYISNIKLFQQALFKTSKQTNTVSYVDRNGNTFFSLTKVNVNVHIKFNIYLRFNISWLPNSTIVVNRQSRVIC